MEQYIHTDATTTGYNNKNDTSYAQKIRKAYRTFENTPAALTNKTTVEVIFISFIVDNIPYCNIYMEQYYDVV